VLASASKSKQLLADNDNVNDNVNVNDNKNDNDNDNKKTIKSSKEETELRSELLQGGNKEINDLIFLIKGKCNEL